MSALTQLSADIARGNKHKFKKGDNVIILGYPQKIQGKIVVIEDELVHNSLTGLKEVFKVARVEWKDGTSYIWVKNLQKVK